MADPKLGRALYEAGWDQGVVFGPLATSLVFSADDPLTRIAKNAKEAATKVGNPGGAIPPHAVATGITKQDERLVLITQACDLVKDPAQEPTVLAMRAFTTKNDRMLRAAASNSAQFFLLDSARSLVADATYVTVIEKPLLAGLKPEPGATDDTTRAQFARWIARRFNRPALDDRFVEAIVKPILENLRQLQDSSDPLLRALDDVNEVRLMHPNQNPPHEVRLLFIVPSSDLPDGGHALAELVAKMRSWFEPSMARLAGWDARDLADITVADYQQTDQIYLDHYTYQGEVIVGLGPPHDV